MGAVHAADSVVTVKAIPPAEGFEPGKPAVMTVELAISESYHINSNVPLQDFLIPTTLELEPQQGVTFGKPEFPPAPPRMLNVSDTPMAVYDGTVRIAVEVIPSGEADLSIPVRGKIRYQACDDNVCLPPVSESFSFRLDGKPETVALQIESPAGENEVASSPFDDRRLLVTFSLVFLGGLALNLTPCVYPMIPITITYFGGQAQGKKGNLILHSLLYVIGMAVTYSVLGVVAAMTGGLFGGAYQYPPVLAGIALVMVLLALSMFDVYELRLPGFLNRLAGGSQKGFGGTLLMGLTVGIVAAPCIGPFVLGLLTYVGNQGNAMLGFGLFFVLSLGLGLPFVVLAFFSGSIHRLPRSGAWMVWIRKLFGFVLLAMAVYFLQPLFPGRLAYNLALALILFLAGIYLAWIDRVASSGRTFAFVRNLVGAVFFGAALYAAVTGLETSAVSRGSLSNQVDSGQSIRWLPYSDEILKEAAREGKPVFIDFYADWCAPCKELDTHTFSTPEVIERSREFVMLKVDLTSAGDPKAESLRKKYGALGVPTLVFLRPDGKEIVNLRITGFEPKEVLLEKMNEALNQSIAGAVGVS